jgi:uncharacterized protein YjeT (DUF2065 family)
VSIILYAFSFLYIIAGSCFILYTAQSRAFVQQLFTEIPARVTGALALGAGLLLLVAAPAARNDWFITLLGLLGLIKGGLFLVNPLDAYRRVKIWYARSAGDTTFRFVGIVSLVIGTAVLSWIR